VPAEGGGGNGTDWRWKTSRMGQVGHGGRVRRSCYRAKVKGDGGFDEEAFAMRTQIFQVAQAHVLPCGLGWRAGTVAHWNRPWE
jgi:ribosomal protein S6E (S10)